MSRPESLPFRALLEDYQKKAQSLFDALKSGDEDAQWRFKWEHPRFRGKSVREVQSADLALTDAQIVVAHEYSFETWAALAAFADVVKQDGPVTLFEIGVEAVISGDIATLHKMLREHPELSARLPTQDARAAFYGVSQYRPK